MKVLKGYKVLVMISILMLVVSSCGKKSTATDASLRGPSIMGSCDPNATGDNVYSGDIVTDTYGDPYGYQTASGSVKLTVNSTGGLVPGQFAGSALLILNGSQYCCTSQGVSGVLGYPDPMYAELEDATVSGLALSCQSAGSTGYFGGSYQTVTLKIGIPVPPYSGGNPEFNGIVSLRKDKRMMGYIEVSSGVQGLSPIPTAVPYFIE